MGILFFLFFSILGFSQEEADLIQQTRSYLDEIRNNNPSSQKKVNLRTGLIQIKGNTPGIALNNGDDTLPFVGMEWTTRFKHNWGTEIRALYGQNILYEPSNTQNEADIYFRTIDAGIRYIIEFDPSRKSNYFVLKLLYHQTSNNFEVSGSGFKFVTTDYNGIAAGIERGVTITDKIHLNASLDILYTLDVAEDTPHEIKDNGYALFARGEFHYLVDWFGRRGQVGLSYWQAAYSNEFSTASKVDSGRQNFVTTYRLLSVSYSFLY